MRAADDLLRQLVVDLRERHVEIDAEPHRAVSDGHERDLAVDRHVADLGALAAAHHAERALEAGGVADGEELLGVSAATLAAQLRGRAQLDVERPSSERPCPAARPPVTVARAV